MVGRCWKDFAFNGFLQSLMSKQLTWDSHWAKAAEYCLHPQDVCWGDFDRALGSRAFATRANQRQTGQQTAFLLVWVWNACKYVKGIWYCICTNSAPSFRTGRKDSQLFGAFNGSVSSNKCIFWSIFAWESGDGTPHSLRALLLYEAKLP